MLRAEAIQERRARDRAGARRGGRTLDANTANGAGAGCDARCGGTGRRGARRAGRAGRFLAADGLRRHGCLGVCVSRSPSGQRTGHIGVVAYHYLRAARRSGCVYTIAGRACCGRLTRSGRTGLDSDGGSEQPVTPALDPAAAPRRPRRWRRRHRRARPAGAGGGGLVRRPAPVAGLRPTVRFALAAALTIAWVAVSVWCRSRGDDLDRVLGPVLAWVIPILLAYVPGLADRVHDLHAAPDAVPRARARSAVRRRGRGLAAVTLLCGVERGGGDRPTLEPLADLIYPGGRGVLADNNSPTAPPSSAARPRRARPPLPPLFTPSGKSTR